MLLQTHHIKHILALIPTNMCLSYKTLADIFFTHPRTIQKIIGDDSRVRRFESKQADIYWKPQVTNHYISLSIDNHEAITHMEKLTHAIRLAHPGSIFKAPYRYHITLADLSITPLSSDLITRIFSATDGAPKFTLTGTLNKPYRDTEKNKVVFRIILPSDPFLLTVQSAIKQLVRWHSDKPFIPHITLGKLLGRTSYDENCIPRPTTITCECSTLYITANIGEHKDVAIFSHELWK